MRPQCKNVVLMDNDGQVFQKKYENASEDPVTNIANAELIKYRIYRRTDGL